ncbi:MAG: DUF4430 domain-containing protein [Oscillospiraceae bacterium]|nr:DUF4430 domain-containing protein [Oscillospiraceae bacterium]
MKRTSMKKTLSLIFCIVLIAAMALVTTGCSGKPDDMAVSDVITFSDGDTIGEGKNTFPLTIVHKDGTELTVTVNTELTVVGEALQELGLINGEEGPYGLYIKTVNGETLDYDKDGKYWAFYIDGEYALEGIDLTEIAEGAAYMLKAE